MHFVSLKNLSFTGSGFCLSPINLDIKKGEFFIDNVEILTNTIIMVLKGVLIKAKASNMGFDEAQQILTKHIIYLLDQCTRKVS